jgi:hypothetical protein
MIRSAIEQRKEFGVQTFRFAKIDFFNSLKVKLKLYTPVSMSGV